MNQITTKDFRKAYRLEEIDQAVKTLRKGLAISEEIGDNETQIILHENIGLTFLQKQNWKESLPHLMKSFTIASDIGYSKYIISSGKFLGQVLSQTGIKPLSIPYLEQAYAAAQQTNNQTELKEIEALLQQAGAEVPKHT